MPDYLTASAIDVWQEELGRVMAAGTAKIDSSLFLARGACAPDVRPGTEPPPAAYLNLRPSPGNMHLARSSRQTVAMSSEAVMDVKRS